MTQCAGTTLKGERCKREAREGSRYCSIHFEQPARAAPETEPAREQPTATGAYDADWMMKAALGFAVVAALVLFRGRR